MQELRDDSGEYRMDYTKHDEVFVSGVLKSGEKYSILINKNRHKLTSLLESEEGFGIGSEDQVLNSRMDIRWRTMNDQLEQLTDLFSVDHNYFYGLDKVQQRKYVAPALQRLNKLLQDTLAPSAEQDSFLSRDQVKMLLKRHKSVIGELMALNAKEKGFYQARLFINTFRAFNLFEINFDIY